MFSKTTGAAIAATAAIFCAGATFGGGLTEGPHSDMFGDTTDWGPVMLTVPQFNDMGGARTLTKVTIEWNAGVAGSARVESLDTESSAVTATLAAVISINGPSGFGVTPMPSDDRTFDAQAHDGVIDFDGDSGASFPDIAANLNGMTMFTNPSDLTPFVGNGDVVFGAEAVAMSTATGPGNVIQQFETDASASVAVTYEYIEVPQVCLYPTDVEPNDHCDPNDIEGSCNRFDFLECGPYIDGKLEKRYVVACEPDTFMVLFDKLNNIVNQDDNGSDKGNGWASGLFGVNDANGIINNGDGTRGVRIGVTGRPDGLDGVFNGLFQNGPHAQLGKFTLCVTFLDDNGEPLVDPLLPQGGGISPNPVTYTDEFVTGAEAFHINYTLPQGTVSVDISIDNSIVCEEVREDVDFFCIENLVPLCDYCVTQIGGLDCECKPTATAIGWFDKSCELIDKAQGNQPIPGYTQLCIVADVNGRAIIAVSGANDCDFNGVHDAHESEILDRAPIECDFQDWGHGVAGCYTLEIQVIGDHGNSGPSDDEGETGNSAAIENAMLHGDLNMDGATDTADLGILIGNFGWTAQ